MTTTPDPADPDPADANQPDADQSDADPTPQSAAAPAVGLTPDTPARSTAGPAADLTPDQAARSTAGADATRTAGLTSESPARSTSGPAAGQTPDPGTGSTAGADATGLTLDPGARSTSGPAETRAPGRIPDPADRVLPEPSAPAADSTSGSGGAADAGPAESSESSASPASGPLVSPDSVPDWLAPLVAATADLDPRAYRRLMPARPGGRTAAVLMLFGDGTPETGPDLLLLRRADTLGAHPGQVAFPGGSTDPEDDGPVGTALREAVEEVGLEPDGVRPVALLPRLYVPVSGFDVAPVIAYWQRPSPVRAVDPAETAAVARVPISLLTDPAHRIMVRHPSGPTSPAYLVPGMLVWGFTAGLVSIALRLGGWDRPWRTSDVRDLDQAGRDALALSWPESTPDPSSATPGPAARTPQSGGSPRPPARRPHGPAGTVRPESADEEAS